MDNDMKKAFDGLFEEIAKLNKRMEVIEFKVDRVNTRYENMDLKIDNLDLRVRNVEANIRKDLKKLSDENETVIEILKIHDILPR